MQDSLIKHFQSFYEFIQFPVQVINETGKIVYVNSSFISQWGYQPDELKEYILFDDPDLKRNGIIY
jgi:PAS domain S-box-containing protein